MSATPVPTYAPPAPVASNSKTGLSTAALVLGIVGVCVGLIPLLGIIALPLGVIGLALRRSALIAGPKFATADVPRRYIRRRGFGANQSMESLLDTGAVTS